MQVSSRAGFGLRLQGIQCATLHVQCQLQSRTARRADRAYSTQGPQAELDPHRQSPAAALRAAAGTSRRVQNLSSVQPNPGPLNGKQGSK